MAKKTCPECKAPMAEALYGMPSPEVFDNPKYVIMGCLMDEDPLRFACKSCGFEIYSSGLTHNPTKEGN